MKMGIFKSDILWFSLRQLPFCGALTSDFRSRVGRFALEYSVFLTRRFRKIPIELLESLIELLPSIRH